MFSLAKRGAYLKLPWNIVCFHSLDGTKSGGRSTATDYRFSRKGTPRNFGLIGRKKNRKIIYGHSPGFRTFFDIRADHCYRGSDLGRAAKFTSWYPEREGQRRSE
jgi:hypothetical protein